MDEGSGNDDNMLCSSGNCTEDLSISAIYGIGVALVVIVVITAVAIVIAARRVSRKWKARLNISDDDGYLFLKPKPNQIELQTFINSGSTSDEQTHSPLMELSCPAAVIIHNQSTPTPPITPPTAVAPSVETVQTFPAVADEGVKEDVQVVLASELTPLSEAPKRKKNRRDYDHLVKSSSPNRAVFIISSGSISSQPLLPKKEEEQEEKDEDKEEKQIVKEKLPEVPTQETPRVGQASFATMLSCPAGSSSTTYDHIPLKESSSLPTSRAVPSQTCEPSIHTFIPPEDDTYDIPDGPSSKSGAWRDSHIYSTIDGTNHESEYSQDGEIPVASVSDSNSKDYSYAATHQLVSSSDGAEHGTFTEGSLQPSTEDDAAQKGAEGEEMKDGEGHKKPPQSSSAQRASYLLILPPFPRLSRSFSCPNIGSVALASSYSGEDNGHATHELSYDDLVLAVGRRGGRRYYNLPDIPRDYEQPISHKDGKCTAPLWQQEAHPSPTHPTNKSIRNKSRTLPDNLQIQAFSVHIDEHCYAPLITREVHEDEYTHLKPTKNQLLPPRHHQQRASSMSRVYENQSALIRSMRFQSHCVHSITTKKYTPLIHQTMLDENDYALPMPLSTDV